MNIDDVRTLKSLKSPLGQRAYRRDTRSIIDEMLNDLFPDGNQCTEYLESWNYHASTLQLIR